MAERADVVVLGAGPSGLAAAACLRQRGVPCVTLERRDAVGSTWRNHYERLHLHTTKWFSSLPGMPFGDDVPTYPPRAEVVSYLERYAERFGVAPRFGVTVSKIVRDTNHWRIVTDAGDWETPSVVVATGYNRVPVEPTWPGQERFVGDLLHSVKYRHGAPWRGRRVLVVGAGNSGAEIALDLWESGARVAMSVRSPVHVVPRDVLGIPAQLNALFGLGRLPPRVADRIALMLLDRVTGDLSKYGLRRPAMGPASMLAYEKRVPMIDLGTVALIRQGHITVYPGPSRFTESAVVFDDGREAAFDAVVLATGYRTGLDALLDDASLLDARAHPRVYGAESPPGGIYFIGYRNPLVGQLYDIAHEAQRVADHIAAKGSRRVSA